MSENKYKAFRDSLKTSIDKDKKTPPKESPTSEVDSGSKGQREQSIYNVRGKTKISFSEEENETDILKKQLDKFRISNFEGKRFKDFIYKKTANEKSFATNPDISICYYYNPNDIRQKFDDDLGKTIYCNLANYPFEIAGENTIHLINKIVRLESIYLNIPPASVFYYYDSKDESYGYSIGYDNSIYINMSKPMNSFFNYRELIDTVIHENRHLYQFHAMLNSDKYPEIKSASRDYLLFSDDTYPTDENAQDYNEKYLHNGLEVDTTDYTNARVEMYLENSIDGILNMDKPPEQIVTNQILMTAGTRSQHGVLAPITVDSNFWGQEFKEYCNNQYDMITHKKIYTNRKETENSMGDRRSYKDDEMREGIKLYGELLDAIQSKSQSLLDDLEERYTTHPSEDFKRVINIFVENFNDNLKKNIKDTFEKWENSENSLAAAARNHEEGEASETAALNTQKALEEEIDEHLSSFSKFEKNLAIDKDSEMIAADIERVDECVKELLSEKSEWLEKFEVRRADNSLYGNLKQVARDTYDCVYALYQNIISDLKTTYEVFGITASQNYNISNNAKEIDVSKLVLKKFRRK